MSFGMFRKRKENPMKHTAIRAGMLACFLLPRVFPDYGG
jgi:hypothetical protein